MEIEDEKWEPPSQELRQLRHNYFAMMTHNMLGENVEEPLPTTGLEHATLTGSLASIQPKMGRDEASRWFVEQRQKSADFLPDSDDDAPDMTRWRWRLFCFPWMGGNSQIFDGLSVRNASVTAVEYPGRLRRYLEAPLGDVRELATEFIRALDAAYDLTDNQFHYAFLGHEFGALVAFEACRILQRAGGETPRALFVASCAAPNMFIEGAPKPIWNLAKGTEAALLEYVDSLEGGLPAGLHEQPQLFRLGSSVLRADLRAAEGYAYSEEDPLECQIIAVSTVFTDQPVGQQDVESWEEETSGVFSLKLLVCGMRSMLRNEDLLLEYSGMITGRLENLQPVEDSKD